MKKVVLALLILFVLIAATIGYAQDLLQEADKIAKERAIIYEPITQSEHLLSALRNILRQHWLNGVIIIILIGGLIKGYFKGFFIEVFRLLGIVLAIIFAFHNFHQPIGNYLVKEYGWSAMLASGVGFSGLFVVTVGVCVLLGLVLRIASWILGIGWLDRVGGAAFGMLKMLLLVSFLLNASLLLSSPAPNMKEKVKKEINTAQMASPVADIAPILYNILIKTTPLEKKFKYERFFPESSTFARDKIRELARKGLNKDAVRFMVEKGITDTDRRRIKEILRSLIEAVKIKDAVAKLERELERIDIDKILKQLAKGK